MCRLLFRKSFDWPQQIVSLPPFQGHCQTLMKPFRFHDVTEKQGSNFQDSVIIMMFTKLFRMLKIVSTFCYAELGMFDVEDLGIATCAEVIPPKWWFSKEIPSKNMSFIVQVYELYAVCSERSNCLANKSMLALGRSWKMSLAFAWGWGWLRNHNVTGVFLVSFGDAWSWNDISANNKQFQWWVGWDVFSWLQQSQEGFLLYTPRLDT